MKVYSANLQSQGKKYAIVLARFNEFIAVSYTHLTLPTKRIV